MTTKWNSLSERSNNGDTVIDLLPDFGCSRVSHTLQEYNTFMKAAQVLKTSPPLAIHLSNLLPNELVIHIIDNLLDDSQVLSKLQKERFVLYAIDRDTLGNNKNFFMEKVVKCSYKRDRLSSQSRC